jgi:hypothetical protein
LGSRMSEEKKIAHKNLVGEAPFVQCLLTKQQ